MAVTIVFLVLCWVAVSAYNGVPFRSYTTMYVSVASAGNLLQHDQVRIAGVRVGQVQGKSIAPDGRVRLTLQLEPGVTLPSDTSVALRASGLLGARYVQLVPGRSTQRLAPGATISAPDGALTYGVPEALDTFDAQTRGALGSVVGELGQGVLGRGRGLGGTLRAMAPEMVPFQQLITTILARPGAAQRLIPSVDLTTSALAGAHVDIAAGLHPAASALQPFVDQRPAVQAALDQAPRALSAADSGLAAGEQLLGSARALATAAAGTLPDAPTGLQEATALLRDTDPLQRASALLQTARPAVPATLRIVAAGLSPLLPSLSQTLDTVTPMLRQISPYGCDIENFGAVFRSMTGLGGVGSGPNGPLMAFRLQVVPPGPLAAVGLRDTIMPLTRDSYPPPCKYLARPYPSRSSDASGLASHPITGGARR
jgi:virulence factor Mce-like protein